MKLDRSLLESTPLQPDILGDHFATLKAHGLYNTFQFVLRLSPEIHRKLAATPSGIVSSGDINFENIEAFSTFLHETIHWWQHIGSTYGLMLSLSFPSQSQANYTKLKSFISQVGFKKSIRRFIEQPHDKSGFGTPAGTANIIVNNTYDISSYRRLTHSPKSANSVVADPLFECVGHAYEMAYSHNVVLLADTADPGFDAMPHPKDWASGFQVLRDNKAEGWFNGSRIILTPIGALEIFEGQARFAQLQYLHFATGGQLTWEHAREFGLLEGVYVEAFRAFLQLSELPWPDKIDHPVFGLFLLICDMAINPGAGFPFAPVHFSTFVNDTDPGQRFVTLSRLIHLRCPEVAKIIHGYTRAEYESVSSTLAQAFIVETPIQICNEVSNWIKKSAGLRSLMAEYASFKYNLGNLVPRVLFSHFLAFASDKLATPEFFCWPGAWMAGERVSEQAMRLFDKHGALFVDKADDDSVFPRLQAGRNEANLHEVFQTFYAVNVSYDMTNQWVMCPGPFVYDYAWLKQQGTPAEFKSFADGVFKSIYAVEPDAVELL